MSKPATKKGITTKKVRQIVKSELKKEIQTKWTIEASQHVASYVGTNTTLTLLNPVPKEDGGAGTGDESRIGQKIRLKRMLMHFYMEIDKEWSLINDPKNIVRIIIVRNTSGNLPLQTYNLIRAVEVVHAGSNQPIDPVFYKNRFGMVLYDRTFPLALNFDVKHTKIDIPINAEMTFDGNGGTDVQDGGLYMLVVCDTPATNHPPNVEWCAVTYYTDG